jgi:protein TonB
MKNPANNLDDIIFGDRNKSYGAYQMRKGYHKNVVKALIIGILLFGSGITIPLIANYMNDDNNKTFIPDDVIITIGPVPPDETEPLPDLPEEKKAAPSLRNIITSLEPEIELDIDDLIPAGNNQPVSDTTFIDNEPEKKPEILKTIDPIEEPILAPEEVPEFPGGESARMKFMHENLIYPEPAHSVNLQGTVVLTFVIEKDGSLNEIKVLRSVGGGCDEEAIRVISAMPKWKPGKQGGRPVRVRLNIPISFRLN